MHLLPANPYQAIFLTTWDTFLIRYRRKNIVLQALTSQNSVTNTHFRFAADNVTCA